MSLTQTRIRQWISHLSIPEVYVFSVVLLFVAWLLYSAGRHGWAWFQEGKQRYRYQWCIKATKLGRYVSQSLLRLLSRLDIATWGQACVLLILVIGNAVALSFQAPTWTAVQKRAALLAVINLIPLCTGLNFAFPADLLYIERNDFAWFHRWLGRIFVIHTLLHSISAVSSTQQSRLRTPQYFLPMLAGICFVLIIAASWPVFQRRYPQISLKIHYILGICGIGTVAYHLVEQDAKSRWYLLVAGCLWVTISGVVGASSLLANRPWTQDRPEITMDASKGLLWLELSLCSSWKVHPGQYLQLWMPGAGPRAWMQLPLLYVVVCHNDKTHKIVRMVTRPHVGLMKRLYEKSQVSTSRFRLPATVLGPYGHPPDLLGYGTVVMVVEDIGFFRVLSYIEMLVEASRRRKALVRKLEILWEDNAEPAYPPWVKKWRQDILKADFHGFKILQFKIYCGETTLSEGEPTSYQEENRLCFYRYSVDIETEMKQYLQNQQGDMVVAVCAGQKLGGAVRRCVQPHVSHALKLISLDLGLGRVWSEHEDAY